MSNTPTLPAPVRTPKDVVDSVPVRADYPICCGCGGFIRAGGEVDPMTGKWFHEICGDVATGRRWL